MKLLGLGGDQKFSLGWATEEIDHKQKLKKFKGAKIEFLGFEGVSHEDFYPRFLVQPKE